MLVSESSETRARPVPVLAGPQVTTVETERVRLMPDGVKACVLGGESSDSDSDGPCSDSDSDGPCYTCWDVDSYVDVHTTTSTSYLRRPDEESDYEDCDDKVNDLECVTLSNERLLEDVPKYPVGPETYHVCPRKGLRQSSQ